MIKLYATFITMIFLGVLSLALSGLNFILTNIINGVIFGAFGLILTPLGVSNVLDMGK